VCIEYTENMVNHVGTGISLLASGIYHLIQRASPERQSGRAFEDFEMSTSRFREQVRNVGVGVPLETSNVYQSV